jgi:ABC-2 type transport system permease protein
MAMTSTHAPMTTAGHARSGAGTPTFASVVRSEFTKIRSVRSTYWTLLVLVVVTVGFGALASYGATRGHHPHGPGFDATQQSLGGLYISQLVIGVLGVLVISSEYSTGMIRTTLTTLPRRGLMIAAKAVVFAVVAFVTGLITCFASFFLGQAIMSSDHISASLSQPNVLRAVIGGALFLTACGLLAFGLGLLLRHTAGAITTVVGLLFLLTILVNFLPSTWQDHIDKWMPAMAGTQIWTTVPSQGQPAVFAPWTGFAVLCGYAAIALIAGLILFRKRDA